MVDIYGIWTYEAGTPEDKKCDCDRIADWVVECGYIPQTSMENLVEMIISLFDDHGHFGEYDSETGCGGYGDAFSIEGCKRFVEESGGFAEFDYYC